MARLDAQTRWARHRVAVERWKDRNRAYYLEQKRRLAQRPEYLQRRREKYAQSRPRQTVESTTLSSEENDTTTTNETTGGRGDRGGVAAVDPAQWAGLDLTQWAAAHGAGRCRGEPQRGRDLFLQDHQPDASAEVRLQPDPRTHRQVSDHSGVGRQP